MQDNWIYDADEVCWERVVVKGIPMTFTDARINADSVPKGLYKYEVSFDPDWARKPCELALSIKKNLMGTLLSAEPIDIEGTERIRVRSEDEWIDVGMFYTPEELLIEAGDTNG